MKSISQFSPASFLFQGARNNATLSRTTNTSASTATQTAHTVSSSGGDRATLSGGGELSLGDQMRNLKAKVGKASGSWLQQTRQDLGLASRESKEFKARNQERGWDVKGPENRSEFTPEKLDGKPVAFRVKDEATGEMVEKKGFLRKSGEEGSSSFRLDGQKGEFDAKHLHDFSVNSDPAVTPQGQKFRDKFENQGWTAKNHQNGFDFSPNGLRGREVAFQTKDPKTGEMVEKRGVLEPNPDPKQSAIFKLKGQDGEFNNNYIKEMAVNDSFDKNMKKEGWTLKGEHNLNDFAPDLLNGREVAFRTKDPETGEMVERRGVMEANKDPNSSAMFKLKGQEGEFNNNYIKEIAVNDKFGQEYRERGWTVKDPSNAEMFHPRQMDGQHVAFRHPDPETGQMMEHAGKVQVISSLAMLGLSLFSMVGMVGMYNSAIMPEMAINPQNLAE
jgi:hypothetical protein